MAPPGSSPLARGLPFCEPGENPGVRIIPARAGFTILFPYTWKSVGGSSPLARGLQMRAKILRPLVRIIPARAGFTSASCPTTTPPTDHPRSRGVYGGSGRQQPVQHGSSPLARGLPAAGIRHEYHGWIIPARAGFTDYFVAAEPEIEDHPRSRGVYACHASFAGLTAGSSPLARGLRGRGAFQEPKHRIIPARAGFTGSSHLRVW